MQTKARLLKGEESLFSRYWMSKKPKIAPPVSGPSAESQCNININAALILIQKGHM